MAVPLLVSRVPDPPDRTTPTSPPSSSVAVQRRCARRILVVDEEVRLTEVITTALKVDGWQVAVASTGREALDQAAQFSPDATLLDISLPDAVGPGVVKALREHGDWTPVMYVTGRDTLDDRLAAFGAGGDDYLTKPFGLDVMVQRLQNLLTAGPQERVQSGGRGHPADHS